MSNSMTKKMRPVNSDGDGIPENPDGGIPEIPFDPTKLYPRSYYLQHFHISKETFKEMVWEGLPVIVAAPRKKAGKGQYVYGMDWIAFCRREKTPPKRE